MTTTTTSATPSSTQESTEYGAPRGATGTRYAWLGGKQRAADTPGGLSIMGVRLYNAMTGKFLQVDPVYGGNDNAYTYPTDPLTQYDLDGRKSCNSKKGNWFKRRACNLQHVGGRVWRPAAVVGTYAAAGAFVGGCAYFAAGMLAGACAGAAGGTAGTVVYRLTTKNRTREGYAQNCALGAVSGGSFGFGFKRARAWFSGRGW